MVMTSKKPPARLRYKAEAVLRKVRVAHRKPAENTVSGPTFFEITRRPALVDFVNPNSGELVTFDLKTAKFTIAKVL